MLGFLWMPMLLLSVGHISCDRFYRGEAREDGRTKITWMVQVDLQRPLLEELVARFEQLHPDIDVEIMWIPRTQYQAKFKTLVAAGQSPDIIYCGDVWVAYLLPFLYDITDFVKRDSQEIDLDDFYPEVIKACQYRGKYYYLPRWFNISLLYYNKKIFDEAGEPYPTADWTWDDYIRAGKKLTKVGKNGKAEYWGSDIVIGWWGEWLILIRQAGGSLFNDKMTKCTLDSPEAIQGMQFYFDKVHRYGISPQPGYGPDNGFASGKLAMLLGGHTGSWIVYNKISGLDWNIQLLPKGPKTRKGGEIAMDAFGISRTSKHPEAAWELLKFLVSKEAIRKQVNAGYLSVRKSVAQELLLTGSRKTNPRNIQAVYEALKYAQPIPRSPDFIELAIDIIQPEIDRMLYDRLVPAETCKKAARAANEFITVLGSDRREP